MDKLKRKFIKIYANIPIGARSEIVAIVDEKTLTFNQIYDKVIEGQVAEKALKNMKAMEII